MHTRLKNKNETETCPCRSLQLWTYPERGIVHGETAAKKTTAYLVLSLLDPILNLKRTRVCTWQTSVSEHLYDIISIPTPGSTNSDSMHWFRRLACAKAGRRRSRFPSEGSVFIAPRIGAEGRAVGAKDINKKQETRDGLTVLRKLVLELVLVSSRREGVGAWTRLVGGWYSFFCR